MTPSELRKLEASIVDRLPDWRRQLVWEYGLREVLQVDANVPERAVAQLQARRKAAQEQLLIDSALPIKAEDRIEQDRPDGG